MNRTVLIGPSCIDGGVSRLVQGEDGRTEVQTWGPSGWRAGGASVGELMMAPPASVRMLTLLGVPESDWGRGSFEQMGRTFPGDDPPG